MDASDIGFGAVLSQRSEDGKLHPCASLFHQFSPSERNYDVGIREFLAVQTTTKGDSTLDKPGGPRFLVSLTLR